MDLSTGPIGGQYPLSASTRLQRCHHGAAFLRQQARLSRTFLPQERQSRQGHRPKEKEQSPSPTQVPGRCTLYPVRSILLLLINTYSQFTIHVYAILAHNPIHKAQGTRHTQCTRHRQQPTDNRPSRVVSIASARPPPRKSHRLSVGRCPRWLTK